METPELVEVKIDSVRTRPDPEHRVVVLRPNGGDRILPIWIGPFEADAIAMALEGRQFARPMTHDLTVRLLETLQTRVQRVVVNKLVEDTFYAEIALAQGQQYHQVDARPSDALALAVRTGTPIYVARDVLESDCAGPDDDAFWKRGDERVRKFHERDSLNPTPQEIKKPDAE